MKLLERASARREEATESESRWQAVLTRDPGGDAFVYAVRSTGIYCRPGCRSRRPRRRNVVFFATGQAAAAAGYRACRRCEPERPPRDALRDKVLAACRRLEARRGERCTLRELGREVDLSPGHLQRSFRRIVGVSPREYADALRLGRLKGELRAGEPIAAALYGSGYGSSSRLYEAAPAQLGMTPGAYRRGGAGECIRYAVARCPLGRLLVAATPRGVCAVRLGDAAATLEAELRAEFPHARCVRDRVALGAALEPLLHYLAGDGPPPELPLDVRATAFQRRVWEALRALRPGETVSYGELARRAGSPRGARAAARACARNPVPLLVPCHRALPASGRAAGGYRFGRERKRALLRLERDAAPELDRPEREGG